MSRYIIRDGGFWQDMSAWTKESRILELYIDLSRDK